MLQLPSTIRFEPLKLATSAVIDMVAGSTIPESSITVMNGAGQKMSKAYFEGQKQPLRVVTGNICCSVLGQSMCQGSVHSVAS